MTFSVIDKRTGKEPIFDHNHIFKEKWFKESGLIYCDIDGWYIGEDGELLLIDDCGNVAYPPPNRFHVLFDTGDLTLAEVLAFEAGQKSKELKQGEWNVRHDTMYHFECPFCKYLHQYKDYFCPNCGKRLKAGDEK